MSGRRMEILCTRLITLKSKIIFFFFFFYSKYKHFLQH